MPAPSIHAEYVGATPPTEEGNYLVVNLLTMDQFGIKIAHHEGEDGVRAASNLDCMWHETSDFDDPAYRWYKLSELGKAQCAELATELAMA